MSLDQAVAAVAMYKISIEDMQQAINQLVLVAEGNEQQGCSGWQCGVTCCC